MSYTSGPGPVTVWATLVPRPGKESLVQDVLGAMVGSSRAEPGCEGYDLYRSEEGFHLLERYSTLQALESHRVTSHYQRYRDEISGLIAQPIQVVTLRDVDVLLDDAERNRR